jgi:hypothetical protein
LEQDKPLVRGRKGIETMNSYFYYDSEEVVSNIIDASKRIQEFDAKYPNRHGNFVSAFMEPPYSIQTLKTIRERGEYLIKLYQGLFYRYDDIRNNEMEC